MARVVIPAKTKKLVASGLTKLVADMDTLTVKNPAAIATFRSELASAAQLLTGLSASLESLANQPVVNEAQTTATKARRQQPAPAKQPTEQVSEQPPTQNVSEQPQQSKIPTGRGRKKLASEPPQTEVQPEPQANTEASEPSGLLASKGRKRIRKPKK